MGKFSVVNICCSINVPWLVLSHVLRKNIYQPSWKYKIENFLCEAVIVWSMEPSLFISIITFSLVFKSNLFQLFYGKFTQDWIYYSIRKYELEKYALVIARFRVQYGQYFPSFSYFIDLFHEPLGEWNKSKIWEKWKTLAILCEINVR